MIGLTDEEMNTCWDSPLTPRGMKHARMIEAKLKQKNTRARMTIKEIIQKLNTTIADHRGHESHFESWLTLNRGNN